MKHEHAWVWIPALPAKKYEADSRRLLGQRSYLMLEVCGGVDLPGPLWLCWYCVGVVI